jgi:hypothetical protein
VWSNMLKGWTVKQRRKVFPSKLRFRKINIRGKKIL